MSVDTIGLLTPSTRATDSGARLRVASGPLLFGAGLLALGSITMSSALAPQDVGASTWILTSSHVIQGTSRLATSQRVSRLKEESGLTWGQLADLFGVSRRAVHFWVEGGNMAAHNVARLLRLEVARNTIIGVGPGDVRNGFFVADATGQSLYAKLVSEIAPATPRLMEGPPIESSRPPLSIGPTVPVGSVEIPSA